MSSRRTRSASALSSSTIWRRCWRHFKFSHSARTSASLTLIESLTKRWCTAAVSARCSVSRSARRSSKPAVRFWPSAVSASTSRLMRLFRNWTRPALSCMGRYSGYELNHSRTKSPARVTRGPTRTSHTESGRNWPVSGVSLTQPRRLGEGNVEASSRAGAGVAVATGGGALRALRGAAGLALASARAAGNASRDRATSRGMGRLSMSILGGGRKRERGREKGGGGGAREHEHPGGGWGGGGESAARVGGARDGRQDARLRARRPAGRAGDGPGACPRRSTRVTRIRSRLPRHAGEKVELEARHVGVVERCGLERADPRLDRQLATRARGHERLRGGGRLGRGRGALEDQHLRRDARSEEHTSELQ